MTDYYIDSTATGANNGTSWTDAWNAGTGADWTSAFAAATVAGDRIFVAHDNATVLAANLIETANANHTVDNPLKIIVANSATSVPVSTYGAASNGEISGNDLYDITLQGNIFIHGLRYTNADESFWGSADSIITFEKCLLNLNDTTAERFKPGNAADIYLIDCDINMANADNVIYILNDTASIVMIGGSITTDANVSYVFEVVTTKSAYILLVGVDCTAMNSGTDMIGSSGTTELLQASFENCNWAATLPLMWGGTQSNLDAIDLITATGNQGEVSAYSKYGTVLNETTIRRAGGANDGTNDYSLKIESSSAASRTTPFRYVLAIDNPGDLDTLTIKVHFANNQGTLDNDQIWIECYTPTSTAISTNTDRNDITATATNHTDESASVDWRNGGSALTTYTEQSCSVTVSGATAGLLYVVLCVADDFTTTNNLYVDPEPVIA